jgi:hypothetical protein
VQSAAIASGKRVRAPYPQANGPSRGFVNASVFGRPALGVFAEGRADVLFQNVTIEREQVFAR